jgi:hypothetical protein
LKSVKKKPENGQVEMSYQAESNDDEIVMG